MKNNPAKPREPFRGLVLWNIHFLHVSSLILIFIPSTLRVHSPVHQPCSWQYPELSCPSIIQALQKLNPEWIPNICFSPCLPQAAEFIWKTVNHTTKHKWMNEREKSTVQSIWTRRKLWRHTIIVPEVRERGDHCGVG